MRGKPGKRVLLGVDISRHLYRSSYRFPYGRANHYSTELAYTHRACPINDIADKIGKPIQPIIRLLLLLR